MSDAINFKVTDELESELQKTAMPFRTPRAGAQLGLVIISGKKENISAYTSTPRTASIPTEYLIRASNQVNVSTLKY